MDTTRTQGAMHHCTFDLQTVCEKTNAVDMHDNEFWECMTITKTQCAMMHCTFHLQTEREKANAVDMHTIFQQELVKLRLATAKAYQKVLTDGQVLPNCKHPHIMRCPLKASKSPALASHLPIARTNICSDAHCMTSGLAFPAVHTCNRHLQALHCVVSCSLNTTVHRCH